jgi:hypothetical protein
MGLVATGATTTPTRTWVGGGKRDQRMGAGMGALGGGKRDQRMGAGMGALGGGKRDKRMEAVMGALRGGEPVVVVWWGHNSSSFSNFRASYNLYF